MDKEQQANTKLRSIISQHYKCNGIYQMNEQKCLNKTYTAHL